MRVEPGNRLVVRALEARLEEHLAGLHHVRAVFDAPATSNSQRKQLIRAVISEITLTIDRQARTCHVLIAWQGTATTAVTIPLQKRGGGAITTGGDTLDLITRLLPGRPPGH